MKDKKEIPVILFETKIGKFIIDKIYLDLFECGSCDFILEYKKTNNGNSLLDLIIEVNEKNETYTID